MVLEVRLLVEEGTLQVGVRCSEELARTTASRGATRGETFGESGGYLREGMAFASSIAENTTVVEYFASLIFGRWGSPVGVARVEPGT